DFAELLLEDYKASLKYLSDHPKLQGIAQPLKKQLGIRLLINRNNILAVYSSC
ncbi:hypothetical protein OOZ86_002684, partial [Shigella boydii]|nr:hypothetical protein [Shigella boydii]